MLSGVSTESGEHASINHIKLLFTLMRSGSACYSGDCLLSVRKRYFKTFITAAINNVNNSLTAMGDSVTCMRSPYFDEELLRTWKSIDDWTYSVSIENTVRVIANTTRYKSDTKLKRKVIDALKDSLLTLCHSVMRDAHILHHLLLAQISIQKPDVGRNYYVDSYYTLASYITNALHWFFNEYSFHLRASLDLWNNVTTPRNMAVCECLKHLEERMDEECGCAPIVFSLVALMLGYELRDLHLLPWDQVLSNVHISSFMETPDIQWNKVDWKEVELLELCKLPTSTSTYSVPRSDMSAITINLGIIETCPLCKRENIQQNQTVTR